MKRRREGRLRRLLRDGRDWRGRRRRGSLADVEGGIVSEPHFAKLNKLKKLYLSENLILNVTSNWHLPFRVKEIGMASVKVGPHFPRWLRKQSILEILIMSDANITDMIPNWLSNVTSFMLSIPHRQRDG
ncbi:hypothetical protein T459_07570 [Capsicum annuum]|uniref:Uncharacterized protein n=1 Tax=Capsicum annuum TaxID=4072 RepID=A0A2G2ZU10_CAPAN|nr:hypothetical protein FXO37_24482 [Capsicum annuum]PHT85464.1 hypothetical protein T459_07570 [Capsicum annuum]